MLARPVARAGLRAGEAALANAAAGTEFPFATLDALPRPRQHPLPEHRPGAPSVRDRPALYRGLRPADRRQPRGQAAPARPRVRPARREPGRVQDRLPQRAVADRPARDRATFEGIFRNHMVMPEAASGIRVLQRHDDEWPAARAGLVAVARALTCRGGTPPAIIGAHRAPGPDPRRQPLGGLREGFHRRDRGGRPSHSGSSRPCSPSTWDWTSATDQGEPAGLLVLALIFGVINGLIGPIVRLIVLPIPFTTLGLFGFVINGILLIVVARIAQWFQLDLHGGRRPSPTSMRYTIVAAIVGAAACGAGPLAREQVPRSSGIDGPRRRPDSDGPTARVRPPLGHCRWAARSRRAESQHCSPLRRASMSRVPRAAAADSRSHSPTLAAATPRGGERRSRLGGGPFTGSASGRTVLCPGGEWAIARRAGVPHERITIEGIGKTDAVLLRGRALRREPGTGSGLAAAIELPDEADALIAIARRARLVIVHRPPLDVLFRLNPAVAPETAACGGCRGRRCEVRHDRDRADVRGGAAAWPGWPTARLFPAGIHLHVGSQLGAVDAWRSHAARRGEAVLPGLGARPGPTASRSLDLGGGFPVGPLGQPGPRPECFAGELAPLFEAIPIHRQPRRLAIEPGRFP